MVVTEAETETEDGAVGGAAADAVNTVNTTAEGSAGSASASAKEKEGEEGNKSSNKGKGALTIVTDLSVEPPAPGLGTGTAQASPSASSALSTNTDTAGSMYKTPVLPIPVMPVTPKSILKKTEAVVDLENFETSNSTPGPGPGTGPKKKEKGLGLRFVEGLVDTRPEGVPPPSLLDPNNNNANANANANTNTNTDTNTALVVGDGVGAAGAAGSLALEGGEEIEIEIAKKLTFGFSEDTDRDTGENDDKINKMALTRKDGNTDTTSDYEAEAEASVLSLLGKMKMTLSDSVDISEHFKVEPLNLDKQHLQLSKEERRKIRKETNPYPVEQRRLMSFTKEPLSFAHMLLKVVDPLEPIKIRKSARPGMSLAEREALRAPEKVRKRYVNT